MGCSSAMNQLTSSSNWCMNNDRYTVGKTKAFESGMRAAARPWTGVSAAMNHQNGRLSYQILTLNWLRVVIGKHKELQSDHAAILHDCVIDGRGQLLMADRWWLLLVTHHVVVSHYYRLHTLFVDHVWPFSTILGNCSPSTNKHWPSWTTIDHHESTINWRINHHDPSSITIKPHVWLRLLRSVTAENGPPPSARNPGVSGKPPGPWSGSLMVHWWFIWLMVAMMVAFD